MASQMKEFEASSHLFGVNAPFVEELYERYLADPASVAPEWRRQFDAWQEGPGPRDVAHSQVIAAFERMARQGPAAAAAAPAACWARAIPSSIR
jgi:2-oxoglutarate dehydrogenase E1 component